jgi:elongation factor G
MTRAGIGLGEPDEEAPSPEVGISITVPEEFAGFAMGELNARKGRVTGMDVRGGIVTIGASLPASECDGLSEEVASATLGRGKVERDAPQ